jgi:Ran GTPase-activating protein (RanGAP) involved in mRNA processing and transport
VDLSTVLAEHNGLTSLNLANNNFSGRTLLPLVQTLEKHHVLENVNLSQVYIDHCFAVELAKTFAANQQLKSLDLSNNKLGGRSYYSCKIYGKLLIHYCQ